MKHLLNNISEEEKNRIREQHTGGMKIATDKFKKLVETKQGDVKLYLNEQTKLLPTIKNVGVWMKEVTKGEPPYKLDLIGTPTNSDNEVAIRGLIVQEPTGGLKNEEAFLKYNCDKKEYTINGIGEYGKHLNATAYLTDEAKAGLKMETWCKTYK